LIYGAIDNAAVQCQGPTLYSLSRPGIDGEFRESLRSHIGRRASRARRILAADLTIIDEISMLTLCVANRVSITI
jgi:hypothetical protein